MFSVIMHMTLFVTLERSIQKSDMMQCSSNVLELDYVRTA